jgi:hypothetical protein
MGSSVHGLFGLWIKDPENPMFMYKHMHSMGKTISAA